MFSVVRDPVEKFVSRYFYNRIGTASAFDKWKAKGVPYLQNTDKATWKKKVSQACVLYLTYLQNTDEATRKNSVQADGLMHAPSWRPEPKGPASLVGNCL